MHTQTYCTYIQGKGNMYKQYIYIERERKERREKRRNIEVEITISTYSRFHHIQYHRENEEREEGRERDN